MGIHAWFDDIFTGTSTVKEHNEWLLWVYTHLRDKKLYISKKKFNPFAPVLDILGCKVDTHGVHTENGKKTQGGNSSIDYSASLEGQSNERGPVLRQLATWLLQVQ